MFMVEGTQPGIVSASIISESRKSLNKRCSNCGHVDHDTDARFCKYCSAKFDADDML
ncbi:MAG: hypothetical protein KBS58_02275 [Bacteroidales bacterium]|nr:hypothetical protein [Candidatus Cacconaster equi]